MPKSFRLLVLLSLALLGGCARVATTTTVHADGSYTRKIVYTVAKATGLSGALGSQGGGKVKEKPEDFFKLPTDGSGVKVVRSEEKENLLITTTREIPAGAATVQDLTLWAEQGKVLATSTVSVKKLPNGQIEYIETLHAVTPSTASKNFSIPDLRARVKNVLPAEYQKTEIIDQITRGIMVNAAHVLMGPPAPTLMNIFLDPEGMARQINSAVFKADIETFRNAIPALTLAQATMMSKAIAGVLNADAINQSNPQSSKSNPDTGDLTTMFFCVSVPGKVVETNGLSDPLTGEIYWSLLPMSLDLGDVKLRVLSQP